MYCQPQAFLSQSMPGEIERRCIAQRRTACSLAPLSDRLHHARWHGIGHENLLQLIEDMPGQGGPYLPASHWQYLRLSVQQFCRFKKLCSKPAVVSFGLYRSCAISTTHRDGLWAVLSSLSFAMRAAIAGCLVALAAIDSFTDFRVRFLMLRLFA